MIKKIILFFVIFIASINSLISEIIKYKVISDTFYSDGDIEFTIPIKKDTTVTWESNTSVLPNINDDGIYENFLMDIEYNNEIIYMLSTDLQVIDTEKIVDNKKLLRLIPEYYLEVLCKKNTDLIFEKQPLWNERKKRMENEPFPFEESFQPESYYISNTVILFSQHNYYLVKNVKKKNNNIELDLLHYSDDDVTDYYGKTEDVFSEVYNKFRSNSNIKLLIQNDGDFFDLWINTKENYIGRYIVASDLLCNQIINLVRSNNCDLSKITWPRHADGSCDYEDENGNATASENQGMEEAENAPATEHTKSAEEAALPETILFKPVPDVGKTATVTENLRLRTDDKTAAEVVTTLAAGTRVKVLAPGREDTIDGITSNWAQVEVLDGAKDKDGNAVEAGTKGWLFGGYLSETESAERESPNKEASAAKQGSRLPIVPIAAGGAAFAVLFAVVLLVAKKKKSGKE